MKNYYKHVEAAIQATVFHSPTNYSWFGRRSQQLPVAVRRVLTQETARSYLLSSLQFQLYNDFYCQGVATLTRQEARSFLGIRMTPYIRELTAANSGSGYWEDGWKACAILDKQVVVRRKGLELWARTEDCLVPDGESIAPGRILRLRFPKEFLGLAPGFYLAVSDVELTQEDSQRLVRFYWNLTPGGAVHFTRIVTSLLNQVYLPFKLKVLNDPARFTRCDGVVLYIRKTDYESITKILENIYPEIVSSLRPKTPIFTKLLAPGVGLAEDPNQGESFGLNRCRLLADGMICAYEQGKQALNEYLRLVEDRFAENGISLSMPFLNPGSKDNYYFQPQLPRVEFSLIQNTALHTDFNSRAFLRTAYEIGRYLLKEAVWYRDRCNWMGTEPGKHNSMNKQVALKYRALGSELYSGTSGVALFLAELYIATEDSEVRRAALGAIRQALWRTETLQPPNSLGFYTGSIGIAFVAARIGSILAEEDLLECATHIVKRSARKNLKECEFDLLSGRAGAIVALLVLRNILDHTSLLDFAVRLGDELLQTSDKSDPGYSWKSTASHHQRNLTGFSHGTAGVGYALLELFHATGDAKYSRAAELAFDYERYWFNADASNWPDFREQEGQGRDYNCPPSFANYWCNGAPGIALSRLRAYQILNDEICKTEAIIALQTTCKIVEEWLHSGRENYSLCHGLAGNAEVIHYGHQVLGKEWTDKSILALRVANTGIEKYAMNGHSWPCGIGGGETPSLMLGLAGIGYFYLRLYKPTIPSILILRGEDFHHPQNPLEPVPK